MATYSVGPGGDFATISAASAAVQAGDVVNVAAGIYRESVVTVADGTAAAPITFAASPGAVLMPGAAGAIGWWVKGDYITLDGFEVDGGDGQTWNEGIALTGSYGTVTNATVHNIALGPINDANGAAGIGTDNYYGGEHNNVLNSTVYNIGKDRLDQGIYMSTSGEVKNNTVYDIAAVGIHLWHNATNVLIENNTVHDTSTAIMVGGGDYYNGFTGPDDFTNVLNNTVYNNKWGITEEGNTGTHNTYVGNLAYNNSVADYMLQNGNVFTPGAGASPGLPGGAEGGVPEPTPPPATDWDDVTLPQLLEHFEDHLARWFARHGEGPQANGHHFFAHIDLYWS